MIKNEDILAFTKWWPHYYKKKIISEEFRSLRNVIETFPCDVQPEQMHLIDEEYRTLKFDREVTDLLQSSSIGSHISCEQFWVEVGKISNSDGMLKYKNITKF